MDGPPLKKKKKKEETNLSSSSRMRDAVPTSSGAPQVAAHPHNLRSRSRSQPQPYPHPDRQLVPQRVPPPKRLKYTFSPVPPSSYPSPSTYARLQRLRRLEKASRKPPPTEPPVPEPEKQNLFTFGDHMNKLRIVRTLYERVFFVEDEEGWPIKVSVGVSAGSAKKGKKGDSDRGGFEIEVGTETVLDEEAWADLPRPKGREEEEDDSDNDGIVEWTQNEKGVGTRLFRPPRKQPSNNTTMTWPPRSASDLLQANQDEKCVGCLLRKQCLTTKHRTKYATRLQRGDTVNFHRPYPDDREVAVGYVVENLKMQEVVRAELYPSCERVETPWKSLVVNPNFGMPKDLEIGWEKLESGGCECEGDIARWRKREKGWYKRFKLGRIASEDGNEEKDEVGVFALGYVPGSTPIGETVGALKPDPFFWGVDSSSQNAQFQAPGIERRRTDVERHRIEITIGGQKQKGAEIDDKGNDDEKKGITCFLDQGAYANFTRFVRHSCKPNAERKERRYGDLRMNVLFSIRDIQDLGLAWLEENGECRCGLEECQWKAAGSRRRKRKIRSA